MPKSKHVKKRKRKPRMVNEGAAQKEEVSSRPSQSQFDEEPAKQLEGTQKYTAEQLMAKAEECLESFEPAAACMFVQRALEQDSDSQALMERAGSLLLEAGQPDAAMAVLSRAATLAPNEVSHVTYMYLGQLSSGVEAVTYFRRGVQQVQKQLEQESADENATSTERASLVEALCRAQCSIAEIYMTDLCFEEEAQSACGAALEAALQADSDHGEALQLLASYKLSCGQNEAALSALRRSVQPWLPSLGQQSEQGATAQREVARPEFESRLSASQLAIELEEYHLASQILEHLLDEDDQIVQVWYLLGWLNYLQKLSANAVHYLQQALHLEDKADADDQKLLQHARELLGELKHDEPEGEVNSMSEAEACAAAELDIVSSDEEEMET